MMGSAVAPPARPQAARTIPEAGLLVVALAVAATVELLVLRSGTRTAIHIPGMESLAEPYRVMAWTGRYAYFVAALLLVIAVPVLARVLWQERGLPGRVAAVALVTFAVTAGAARAGMGADPALNVTFVVAVAAAFAGSARRAAGVALFAAAFLFSGAFAVTQQAAAVGMINAADGRWMLRLAEPLVLGFATTLPWTLAGGPGRRALTIGLIAGVLTFALFAAQPATARTILLWNEGLVGSYPALAYAMAAGGAVAAASALATRGRLPEAAAILLLVAGGVGLHSTYQTGLVMVALGVLVGSPGTPLPSRPTRGREPR